MVKKFVYGTPFETEAVVKEIPSSEGNPDYLLHRERLLLHYKAC